MSVPTRREPYRTDTPRPSLAVPERRLWAAVLEAAVDDARGVSTRRVTSKTWGRDWQGHTPALAWFAAPSAQVGAFAWICAALDLEADAVRRALLDPARHRSPLWRHSGRPVAMRVNE